MRIVAHSVKAMMEAMRVEAVPTTGPTLIGIPVEESANLPPGVYFIDEDDHLTMGEYEEGALARAGWRTVRREP